MSVKILYVEDDSLNQAVIKAMLASLGHKEVIIAENGDQALSVIENPNSEVDIVLMDLGLPDMGGIELTEKIRQGTSKLKNVPIVALTGNDLASSREKCVAAGMSGFLGKPFDKEHLRVTLEKLLS